MRQVEKAVMLQTLDTQWKDHLAGMDYLRQGIHLRGYAQKNPKQEYKREAFEMFSAMLDSIKSEVVGTLSRLQLATEGAAIPQPPREIPERQFEFKHEEFHGLNASEEPDEARPSAAREPEQPYVREDRKVGRNEPCPCGSGRKYKHCHGKAS
jgi:preprotein translocase subunit SecA